MKPKKLLLSVMAMSAIYATYAETTFKIVDDPKQAPKGFVWHSEIPDDCPFEQSELFNRVYFTGKFGDYMCGDTYYPSWASDGNLYSPFTDGWTDGQLACSYGDSGRTANTGHSIMEGDDPTMLKVSCTSPVKVASALPYQGRYPAGSLVHNGVWYYGTYCLKSGVEGQFANPRHNGFKFNWPVLGSMPGFQISYDYGKTWVDSPLTPAEPLFPEPKVENGAVKMGAPHFVDFGQNMKYSPDGKAYLIAMGAEDDDPMPRPCITPHKTKGYVESDNCPNCNFAHANLSWITADQVYLARVTPSPETINDESAYEYFAGYNTDNQPVWSDDFEQIKPLLEWNNNMGCVTVTYSPQLERYLMCVTDGWPTVEKMDSYILESKELTGPWSIITYLEDFGEQSYFLNFPSKFLGESGRDMWLCHSANFALGWNGNKLDVNPAGGRYGLVLHEMQLLSSNEKDPSPKPSKRDIFKGNIAPAATVTASSTASGSDVYRATDGVCGATANEWSCVLKNKGGYGEWIKLEWADTQRVSRVLLFDSANANEDREDIDQQIRAGVLEFSDGSTVYVDRELPTRGINGLEVTFAKRDVKWVRFKITKTSHTSSHPGLGEIAVFAK